jgi:proline dehydrogenase
LNRFTEEGMASDAEVSIKLTAIGMGLPYGEELALANAIKIAEHAQSGGMTVTVDMEDYTTTEKTIRIVESMRRHVPSAGIAIQANLHRTERDIARLDNKKSRVRLCKSAYNAPTEFGFTSRHAIDLSYVRCLKDLMAGEGKPLVATHDPRMIEITQELASRYARKPSQYEFQMLYGIRTLEQQRLVELGQTVRVYVPFGTDWYGYFMRRLAERPANLAFFLRSFLGRS